MIYQLPNGKVIDVSLDFYLRATDEEFEKYAVANCYDYVDKKSKKYNFDYYKEEKDIIINIDNIDEENLNDRLNQFIEDDTETDL